MSTGTLFKPNTAAVVRNGTQYIFQASPFTGENNGIIQISSGEHQFEAQRTIVVVDQEMVRTIQNTPLAATIVWDNSQINLYYFAQSTDGAFLREICQKDDADWQDGSLSEYLLQEGVFPAPNSTLTVWTDKEDIHVYFRSSTDGETDLTLAKYIAAESNWQLMKIRYGLMGIAA